MKDDIGEFTGVFRLYFINGKLWIADYLFAKYLFNSQGDLKFWLGETWKVRETETTSDFKERSKIIHSETLYILRQLDLIIN